MKLKYKITNIVLWIAIVLVALMFVPDKSHVQAQQANPATQVQQTATMLNAATKIATANPGVNNQATATMQPSGSNYVYISAITMDACQDATGGTAQTNSTFTSTNLTGSPLWQFSQVSTANNCAVSRVVTFATPLKSSTPGTAATIVSPTANTHNAFTIDVYWYEAP